MPPRLTIKDINAEIALEGYVCTDYDIVSKKFNYICSKGHEGSTRLDHWRRGVRCSVCSGNKKLTLEYIKGEIESEGYTLISSVYVNSKSFLEVKCPEGHEYTVTYNNWSTGYRCSKCFYKANTGENNPNYRGGVTKSNLPLYITFANKLEKYQPVHKIEQDDLELLGVECAHCKKIFVPSRYAVCMRIDSINGMRTGDQHLYCSEECKNLCPIYGQIKYFKNQKVSKYTRSGQESWANLVKEKDSFTCQYCGISESVMYAHHIDPINNNPIESMDIDNGVTLCKSCHIKVHTKNGCKYSELRC